MNKIIKNEGIQNDKSLNDKSFHDKSFWNVRTDLAYDEVITKKASNLEGLQTDELLINNIPVIRHIINNNASTTLNKQAGLYYTLNLSEIDYHDASICENIEHTLATVLNDVLDICNLKNKHCLLVGLGNINVTPDALGPYVMDNVIVTRHLAEQNSLSEGFSCVSAISPGVMGTTGIETFDIIKAVAKVSKAEFLIVVDALASNSLERVNKTIQITDTGISPGSGVGNKRKELSIKTLGIPVIAIGVPTVVDAVTITSEVIDYVIKYLASYNDKQPADKLMANNKVIRKDLPEASNEAKSTYFGEVGLLSEDEKKVLIQEVLTPRGYNLMVTPKEIDEDIEDLAKIIATGINLSLHEGLLSGVTE